MIGNCEEAYEKHKDRLEVFSECDMLLGERKPPSPYYILNALGEGVFVRTNSRKKAQEVVDDLYGKGFYIIRKAIKASVS